MKIHLYLPDFKSIVKNTFVVGGDFNHSVFFYETPDKIIFYKPLGNVLYCTEINKEKYPNDKIAELKSLFNSFEVPMEIMPNQSTVISSEMRY